MALSERNVFVMDQRVPAAHRRGIEPCPPVNRRAIFRDPGSC